MYGIPVDKAELLSTTLEVLLYGFSLLMFGGTVWVLSSAQFTSRANYKMLAVACALFVCSTVHTVIHIIRIMQGLIQYRNTYPGGPVEFFSDVAQWTFVAKCYVYVAQTLIGDGVMIYRCYVVWQSKLAIILPILLWLATGVTGFGIAYVSLASAHHGVFGGTITQWVSAWWATVLVTTLLTNFLLASRIWYVDRISRNARGRQRSQLRPVVHIIVDSGVIYSISVLATLICLVAQTNGHYVVLDMVPPIISITFYLVIIRVGIANQINRSQGSMPFGSSADNSMTSERRNTMQFQVSRSAESKLYSGSPRSPVFVVGSGRPPMSPTSAKFETTRDEELGLRSP